MGSRRGTNRSLVVDRGELLGRVLRAAPACVLLTAPAGYGKSRFAHLLGEAYGGVASCDVSDSTSLSILCRRIAVTLLTSGVVGDGGLAQAVAVLGESERAESEWDQLVDAIWVRAGGARCVVFDNFEGIARSRALADRVARLATLSGDRRVVICSRVIFDAPALRRIPPNEILRLGVGDLEFSEAETLALLEAAGAPKELRAEAIRQSQGWPIAALVFTHAAESGTLREALDSAATAANISEYVITQAFEGLDDRRLDLLGAVARLSPAKESDLSALGTTASAIRALAGDHPFFAEMSGAILVHPLAQKALSEADRGADTLLACARRIENEDPQLAARMYVAAGSQDDAARLLGTSLGPFLLDEVPVNLAAIVGSIDKEALLRHPSAWANTTLLRVYTISAQQRADEARAVWAALPPDCPLPLRINVAAAFYNHTLFLNNLAEGDAIMAGVDAALAAEPPDSVWRSVANIWKQWGLVRSGRLIDVDALRARSKEMLSVPSTHAAFIWEFDARRAVLQLDRDLARRHLENAVELVRSTEAMAYRVLIATGAAFFAWVAGEDLLFQRYLQMLEEDATPAMRGGASYFLECSLGSPERATPKNEARYQRAFASIVGSARCVNGADRRALAEFAVSSAIDDGEPSTLTLAWLCLAFAAPRREKEALREARNNAARIEGGAWTTALDELARNAGPLLAFKQRFSAEGNSDERIIAGYLGRTLGGRFSNVTLTGREFATIVALASVGRALDSAALGAMLFPDEEEAAALKALRVWVSRVRAKFPDYEIIRSRGNAYQLDPNVRLDVYAAEAIVRGYDAKASLSDEQRQILNDIVHGAVHAPSYLPDTEWADALYRRYQEVRRQASLVLARDAESRGDAETAIGLLNHMMVDDPLDEEAAGMLANLYRHIGRALEADRVVRLHELAVSGD